MWWTTILSSNYTKYIAYAALIGAVWVHGYVQGLQHAVEQNPVKLANNVVVLNKVTTKVITKYIKQKEVQKKIDEEIKHEGQSFAIQYPDVGYANNRFVELFDSAVEGTIPPLPSGESGESSGVSYSEVLETANHNTIVGRQWKERALTCETWTQEIERAYNDLHD